MSNSTSDEYQPATPPKISAAERKRAIGIGSALRQCFERNKKISGPDLLGTHPRTPTELGDLLRELENPKLNDNKVREWVRGALMPSVRYLAYLERFTGMSLAEIDGHAEERWDAVRVARQAYADAFAKRARNVRGLGGKA